MNRCLYSQEEALFLNPELLGGKAANLAWLSREGLPVPRWWVVTTDVFTQLLRDNGLSEMVAEALAGIGPDTEPAAIEPIAVRIQQQVLKARLSGELLHAIGELVKGREEQFFAVRSSVLGEDAQGASFAGQMDS